MKKILLTGSTGFIGKNLKTYLSDKYELITPSSSELNLINAQELERFFSSNDIEFIIHCASVGGARGIDDPKTTIEDNLTMLDNLLKYKDKDIRVITFGSGAMYDKSRPLHKVKEIELGTIEPENLYGKSKMRMAHKIQSRTDVLCLNIFACYGYDEKENRLPSYVIQQVLNGQEIIINQDSIFDYLFVEDMQKIIEFFITNIPRHNIINLTPTKSISLQEIAHMVNSFSRHHVPIKIINQQANHEYTGDNSRLKKELQSFQFTPMQIGLKKMYDFMIGKYNA